ncbi:MAG: ABC transporter permease [Thermodesulfobacteriota bacterium]|nr:ABC transporter permease [Thermodesulfobacteriota bacterium]
MVNFYAILKKELRSYFTSPIAYMVIMVFSIISGYVFYSLLALFGVMSVQSMNNPYMQSALNITEEVVGPAFSTMSIIILFITPFLTMRLFSEEKKSGTMELLMTFPVRDLEIILGKFGACFITFLVMLVPTFFYQVILFILGKPELGPILTGYVGLILLGAAFISLGILISTTTENQIIAAVVTFGALLLFWIIQWGSSFAGPVLAKILVQLSIIEHYQEFARGVIDTNDTLFYILFSFFFIFLTMRSLDSMKWRS